MQKTPNRVGDTYCLPGICNAAGCLNLSCNNKIDYIKKHKGKSNVHQRKN